MITLKRTLITSIVLSALITVTASAHKDATGIVKHRMDSMSEMGDAMKTMADMVKGKSKYDSNIIRDSAITLSNHSEKIIEYFPDTDDSRNAETSDALPVIWKSWDRFTKLSKGLEDVVDDLNQVASSDDKRILRMAFLKTAKACSACHDDFRKPKE